MPAPDHLERLIAALDAEREALVREDAALRTMPLAQRVAAGAALGPLDVVTTEHRSRGRVNVILRGKNLHDGFTPGEPVVLGPVGRPDGGVHGRYEGGDDTTVELRVDAEPQGKAPWAVVRRLDFTQLEGQKAALMAAGSLRSGRISQLGRLLLGHEASYRADPLDHPAFAGLDASQRAAGALALGATEIGLVHGPPGTGKTQTLAAILVALVDLGEKPWALGESNAAVDQLALRAAAAGLSVVRIGVSARVGTAALPLTLEHRILHGSRATVLHTLRRDRTRASHSDPALIRELDDAIRDEWQAAKREILANAQVIAMTLGSVQTRGADLANPKTAVVDEASQVWEPAVWLVANRVKRVILAGDPMQLGPVVKSQHPALERSLLSRLVDEGFHFPMLTTQYRMNQVLSDVVSASYGGRLVADVSAANRLIDVVAPPWTDVPMRFLDTAGMGHDEEREDSGSLYNPGELDLVDRVVAELVAAGLDAGRIGVVTPYSAQLARVRERHPEAGQRGVESGTVNSFQGREKDVIIASFVRSNAQQELGFVADPRRLNVTASRARMLFIGIGDSGTLGAARAYQDLIDRAHAAGGYVSGWEI
ncbi:MAG: hypothetical protein EXR69_14875 [Myxococcales bacterium]|nr:hypothetical protein [Myxococcales bacterium]